jgi:homocysteine S-methyltransferase
VNLEAEDLLAELSLLRKKVKSGADFAISQPVFDPVKARAFLISYSDEFGETPPPIAVGIQPLYNSGNAEFLHNEVPGITIPAELRRRMAQSNDPQREGVTIAIEIVKQLHDLIQGVYIIPVFGRYDLAAEVIDAAVES